MSILTSSTPVPIIYVSHLPSASSFYASLTQPLGIQFLSAAPVSPACLNYGYLSPSNAGPRKTIVFSVTQATKPSLSHITLSAPSPKAVLDFHAKSQILNKDLKRGENILEKWSEEERAVTRDFDGNMLEAVYNSSRTRGGQRRGSGSKTGVPVIEIETASSEKEARRVLEWQEQVARSIGETESPKSRSDVGGNGEGRGQPMMKRADSYPLPVRERERIEPSRLLRRETITTEHYRGAEPPKTEKTDTGFAGTAVFGTLLGAAALAGVAYALSRSDSPEPLPARRASDGARRAPSQYTHALPVERIQARSYVSERDRDGNEHERAQPRYVEYTITAPPAPSRTHTTHELSRIDERTHHSSVISRSERGITMVDNEVSSSRFERESQSGRSRTILRESSPERSQAPPPHRERERERERDPSPSRESHVSRRSHRSHRSHQSSASHSPRRRVSTSESMKEKRYHEKPDSSYTSARSHHTASTVKLSPPAVPIPPPAASIVSTSTVRASPKDSASSHSGRRRRASHSHSHHSSSSSTYRDARHDPLPESIAGSARNVPLPESVSGASDWERGSVRLVSGLGREYNEYVAAGLGGFDGPGPGYAASVAPSDSISSVGMKRERDRLRERMVGRDTRDLGRGQRMERERPRERGVVGGW